ncbi:hypothetical protein AGMMS50262_00630 [Bacteroidia bacterium]|nr:hypothetical protein AGMMS50262_00630 [Bacteroidia bacterium]
MRKMNISFYLLFGFILFFTSCVRTENDLFDESAALRINHAVSDAKELLSSAGNGWMMQYFPTNDQSGVTFLFQFDKDGMVTVATKNEYVTTYQENKGAWDVVPESGALLTFNTYIDIFHLFSDPSSGLGLGLGVGLNGDYEFVVMSHTDDFVQLKGKKRGTDITLNRLPANQDWKGYFSILDNINSTLFNANVNYKLHLLIDDKPVYTLSNGISHIFTAVAINENDDNRKFPFIITEKGFRFSQATEIGGKTVRTFELNDNQLVCMDKDVNVKIVGGSLADFYFDVLQKKNIRFDNYSSEVKTVYDKISQSMSEKNRTLRWVAFANNKDYGNSLIVCMMNNQTKAETEVKYSYSFVKESDNEIALSFNGFEGNIDPNGKIIYDSFAGISDLLALINGNFIVSNESDPWKPNTLQFTGVSDANNWVTGTIK